MQGGGGGGSPHQSDATVLEFLVASESALALDLVWVLSGEPRAAHTRHLPLFLCSYFEPGTLFIFQASLEFVTLLLRLPE